VIEQPKEEPHELFHKNSLLQKNKGLTGGQTLALSKICLIQQRFRYLPS
jgi:hypothetical protein